MSDDTRALIRAFAEAYPGHTEAEVQHFLYDERWRVQHDTHARTNRLRARARQLQKEMDDDDRPSGA